MTMRFRYNKEDCKKMGEKKKKEAKTARWKQVLVVGACVLFVVLMVVSGMGHGWLSMFTSVKPGDAVVIDYTIYNAAGNPVITTDQNIYKQAAANGHNVLATKQISVIANQTLSKTIYPVQVYTSNSGNSEFAIFVNEYNSISSGLVGMKTNEQKKITLPASSSMSQLWSAEQLSRNNVNMTNVNIGDVLAMGVSDNPEEMAANSTAKSYLRVAEVTRKTPAGIVVDFGYPTADIRVVSISNSR
jgi:hypothetical protein